MKITIVLAARASSTPNSIIVRPPDARARGGRAGATMCAKPPAARSAGKLSLAARSRRRRTGDRVSRQAAREPTAEPRLPARAEDCLAAGDQPSTRERSAVAGDALVCVQLAALRH